jgi:hypothetical protein
MTIVRFPRGAGAVMSARQEPNDSLDWFATPPWATRALCEHVLPIVGRYVWEPACGDGAMAGPLGEYARTVVASDVHDYGWGHIQHDFLQPFVPREIDFPEVIIFNPPFRLAVEFTERALELATMSVAVLARSVWSEGADRYRRLFEPRPPRVVAQFVERVPMVRGAWNPDATTATSYAWFVWEARGFTTRTDYAWIPPGRRKALTKPDDRQRYAGAQYQARLSQPVPIFDARDEP